MALKCTIQFTNIGYNDLNGIRKEASSVNCEHCGAKVVDGGHLCADCSVAETSTDMAPRPLAKVVPFRPKKRPVAVSPRTAARRRRRAPIALWWIVGIVSLCLVLPYIYPLLH